MVLRLCCEGRLFPSESDVARRGVGLRLLGGGCSDVAWRISYQGLVITVLRGAARYRKGAFIDPLDRAVLRERRFGRGLVRVDALEDIVTARVAAPWLLVDLDLDRVREGRGLGGGADHRSRQAEVACAGGLTVRVHSQALEVVLALGLVLIAMFE